jgi:hypothetical protein
MPRSPAPAALAAALALVGASAWLSAGSGTALASAPAARTVTAPAPVPTAIPAPMPTVLDPSPAAAQSPLDTISIVSASTQPVSGGVQLSVTADSTTAIVTMNSHMLDATSSDDILDLPMTQSATGPAPDGSIESTWTVTIPVGSPPTGLPLGDYDVTVDATDQGGFTLPAGPTVTTLPFAEVPTITPNTVNSVISHDNPAPTISGTVTTQGPGAGNAVAYAGQQVVLVDSVLGNVPLTTDTNGDYSFTFTDPEPGEFFTVQVTATSSVAAAGTPSTTFSIHADPVTISASLSATTVTYGAKVSVKGTVTYKPGTTSVPLSGQAVQVFYNQAVGHPVATAVTDEHGQFSAALPKEATSVHWVLRAAGPYLTTATDTLPMKVDLPTAISGFQASLSQFWQLSFRGCLALPAGIPRAIPSLSGLTIQYAAHPNGPWHSLGALPKQNSVDCGNGGRSFNGTLTAKLNYAYYRASYAGTTDSTGTGYLPAASGRVLAWKYQDRIIGFTVSSRTVPKGGKLTVHGQLQYFSGKWRDYAGQKVYVILRPPGSKTWFFIVVATTNSAGRFSATFTDPVTATWSAEFFGNATHLATLAPTIPVKVS